MGAEEAYLAVKLKLRLKLYSFRGRREMEL
jgi:hypothetical protein